MLVCGLLMVIGGVGAAASVPFAFPMPLCPIADSDNAKVDELKKKYDAAKGTDDEAELATELERAIDSSEISSRYCGDERGQLRLLQIVAAAVAVVGFFAAIIGFFLRRVRPA